MQGGVPSVLVVLVVRDAAAWLRKVLASLARQTHPRIGVMAVDNASTDGSGDILEQVLGSRVMRLDRNVGFSEAVGRALARTADTRPDYVLLLHDDTALAPEAISRLVAAAGRVTSTGIVGPKILDWHDRRILREIGFAADRFGYPHSPLEPGEIDQGQYGAPREVLFISSAAMLIARQVIERVGPPDQRLGPGAAMEFCWRARVAGFRVVVEPRAVALHRIAGERGERPRVRTKRPRELTERAALATLLMNARMLTLLWLLPAFAVRSSAALVRALLARRFDRAGEIVGAWGWNLLHLPGTFRRRARAQAVRAVPDHDVARFTSPATRLHDWGVQASAALIGARVAHVDEGEEPEGAPLRRRVASLVVTRPVAVGWVLGALLTVLAFRDVLFVPRLEGGALLILPDGPSAFFREFASGWRTTGFGGSDPASLALIPMGIASFFTLGDPHLLGRLIVALAPLLAGASCFAAARRLGVSKLAAVIAGACYGLSALTMWSASEGRIATSVLLVALPWLWRRLRDAFAPGGPEHPLRWTVSTAMGLAVSIAFFPGTWAPVAVMLVPLLIVPEDRGSRVRGVLLSAAVAVVAAILVFPTVAALAAAGGAPGVDVAGSPSYGELLRLSPGPAPGSGAAAYFLPLAGLLSFVLAGDTARRNAWQLLAVAMAAIPLAWLSGAGWLPTVAGNVSGLLAAAAFSLCLLVALATGTLARAVRRTAFGASQLAGVGLGALLILGLSIQSLSALTGRWAVGEERLLPAWPVVSSSQPSASFRVLWLGAAGQARFPPPGGTADGIVEAAGTRVAYGITGRAGRSILRLGVPSHGPAFERLERVLEAVLSGRSRHAGGLLGNMGIRFVVAGEGDLPGAVVARLGTQIDLDLTQRAGGLSVYRNARSFPLGVVVPGEAAAEAARSKALLAPLQTDPVTSVPLSGIGRERRGSVGEPGLVLVPDRYDPDWRLHVGGRGSPPFPAFGWAIGFDSAAGDVLARYEGQTLWTLQVVVLVALWAAALWVIRRPAAQARPQPSPVTPSRIPVAAAKTGRLSSA
jgi:GT2 family glycosyltransferase